LASSGENIIEGPLSLSERLAERILSEGSISFRDFMEAALYDSPEGYYARGARIGERGDFVTSPHVTPAFAAAIARRFRRDTEGFEGAVDFVEVGAGEGRFLHDFAAALGREDSSFARRVRLTAVERAAAAREKLATGANAPRILESADELAGGSVSGWIFSNELYDALPVARVCGTSDGLCELRVGVDSQDFTWVRSPASVQYQAYLDRFGVTLEPGQAEISPDAAPLHRRLARALSRGFLVAFDYGHRAPVLYHPLARRNGTIAVHTAGRRRQDPLSRPGEVDLTAHVNWDDLIQAGEREGLITRPIVRQGRYLVEAGLFELVTSDADKWRAYRLVDPEGMGEELSVLIQERC
jgi:SAM-dependent MidA family methyltransferase